MSADPLEPTQEIKAVPPDESEPATPDEEGKAPGEDNPPPSRDTMDDNRAAPGTTIPPQD
jgi:hypothetical protein